MPPVHYAFARLRRARSSCRRLWLLAIVVVVLATGAAAERTEEDTPAAPSESHELLRAGRARDAEASARAALERAIIDRGEESAEAAHHLADLVAALATQSRGYQEETIQLSRRAVALFEKLDGPDALSVGRALKRLAVILTERGELDEAKQVIERALVIVRAAHGSEHREIANLLSNYGTVLAGQGDYQKAAKSLRDALAIVDRAEPATDFASSHILGALANVLVRLGEFDEAESLYLRARDILLAMEDSDELPLATVEDQLSYLYRSKGESEKGLHHARIALELRSADVDADDPGLTHSLLGVSISLSQLGRYDEARPYAARSLELLETNLGVDHARTKSARTQLANIAYYQGDYASARRLYRVILDQDLAQLGPTHPWVADSNMNLGAALFELHELELSLEHLETSIEVYDIAYGPESAGSGIASAGLAEAYSTVGRWADAIESGQRAVRILEREFGEGNIYTASALLFLGLAQTRAGDAQAGLESLDWALRIREAQGMEVHPETAQVYAARAHAQRDLGQRALAIADLERSLDINTQTSTRKHPAAASSESELARLYHEGGSSMEAFTMALAAEGTSRDHLRLLIQGLSEREALVYAAQRPSGLDLGLHLAVTDLAANGAIATTALDAVIRSRATVFDEMGFRYRSAASLGDSTLILAADELAAVRQKLARITVRGPGESSPESYGAELTALTREKERLERELAYASGPFRARRERQEAGLEEVRASLPPGSALVSISVAADAVESLEGDAASNGPMSGRRYLALVLRAGEARPHAIDLGPKFSLDELVSDWRLSLMKGAGLPAAVAGNAEREYRRVARRLRERAWDPLTASLGGVDRVFLVPEGSLQLVNFAALPREEGGYLVDSDQQIHLLSAERELLLPDEAPLADTMLAVGGPDYDTRTAHADASTAVVYRGARVECEGFRELHFGRLSAAGKEVRAIAAIWSSGSGSTPEVLTNDQASETAFKLRSPGKGIIHVATHGFFLDRDCGPSPDEIPVPALRGIGQSRVLNPLLLSGLAFAGANQRAQAQPNEEDGILTAEEIATLDLSATNWLVLSACETGSGSIAEGEGLLGLRRAARLAGARSLILSLWAVEDESTRAWMEELYRQRVEQGRDTCAAVWLTSRARLEAARATGQPTHPFRWAAFVATGDWR